MLSNQQGSKKAESTNPFDFDPSFGSKGNHGGPESEAIITGMDASERELERSRRLGGPNNITASTTKRLSQFLGGIPGAAAGAAAHLGGDVKHGEPRIRKARHINAGKKKLTQWPYDDYHLVQKMYYQKMVERTDNKESTKEQEPDASSIPIFSRPSDPPTIPAAVVGLPLAGFESKAEERAIGIVSTWLFDAGLIDELLANGGMGGIAPGDDVTGEGIEVSATSGPIEGSSKMDKEISKLRSSTKRQLALINSRLNDGVAASGSEVQELVNSVMATKDDIGRLRELSTYISNGGDVERSNSFMVNKYPYLKQAINARKNLSKCFRELGFFHQIPETCDRLREELHAGEWTAHEWSTLRHVCREHVELEIFLVEAEAGMKKRLDEDVQIAKTLSPSKSFNRQAFIDVGLPDNHEEVDRFLKEHVQNVWELGDEIRLRIISGIGNAFDLSMNNPAGMVQLVEAVEVYEMANQEYKDLQGPERGQSLMLRFTDMRATALAELYKDMDMRGADVFKDLQMQAADAFEVEEEVANQQFSAIMRACSELTAEIGFVKNQMAPCFPSHWFIETLWTTCVAHLCSSQILNQIGGPEGHRLPDLTVTQLLDLVAWVENFREVIEQSFPDIGNISSKRANFEERPQLLMENNRSVDTNVAKDTLAWVNNTLWDVHDLAKDEFLYRTRAQTIEWLDNVYSAEHEKTQTAEGRIVTSLCEDVYSLAGVQLRTIRERLTRRSEALVQAVAVIFKNLYEKQVKSRETFLIDFETCCAAANDFVRMSEKCEETVNEIYRECRLTAEAKESLEEQAALLMGLYSNDAIYAGQKTHMYIFDPIEEVLGEPLFGTEWQDELTHNQLAWTLVRTLEDFMEDLENYLDQVMVQKTVEALVSASVVFYLRILLKKASTHTSQRNTFFSDNEKALLRMSGDINTIRDYFIKLVDRMPALRRIVDKEFEFLETVHEVLSIAAGISQSDAHDFILVMQKRIRNIMITKLVVGDLYHLMNPSMEKQIYDLVDSMEAEMMVIAPTDDKAVQLAQDRSTVPGLRLDQMMAKHCDKSKRKRPFKANALEQAEIVLQGWRTTWAGE